MDTTRMGLNRIIQLGFLGVLLLMIINGAAAFLSTRGLVEGMSWVTHTYEVKWESERLLRRLIDAETGQRGFLYTSEDTFLEPYTNALEKIQGSRAAIQALVRDNPAQLQRMEVINELIRQKLEYMQKTIAFNKNGKEEEAKSSITAGTGKQIMDKLRNEINEMNQVESDLLTHRTKDADRTQLISFLTIICGTLISIVIGVFILWLIKRNFLRPINDVISIISSASSEIAATVNQHERTASQQAAAANQTSATIEELSVSSRKSAEQAANAAAMTERSGVTTDQGEEATRQAVAAIDNLKDKIGAMAQQILHLGEQSSQIGGIATVLKDLAGQINMLALNASVEAARAGEHGKGFAVVASEIRKLADESKKSAEQTALLVTDIQKATNDDRRRYAHR